MTAADAQELQTLFERCAAFFEMTDGAPPSPDYAEKELRSRAPGKGDDDTLCLGVTEGDRLALFIHATRDYPKPNEWWLGLLVVDPDARGRGLGAAAHDALLDLARSRGARVMWLAVLTQNAPARRFWQRMGYVERERRPYVGAAGLESTIILMSREL